MKKKILIDGLQLRAVYRRRIEDSNERYFGGDASNETRLRGQ